MTAKTCTFSAYAWAISAILCACGGNEPAAQSPTSAPAGHQEQHQHHGEHGGKEKGEHHGDLPPPVHAFHETLAPLWHDKSPERPAKTCAQADALVEKANATSDKELITATSELSAECKKEGRPAFEAKFKVVHERFHAIAQKK